MNKVIVFRNTLLERSETFILRQILGVDRWHPVCVCDRILDAGLPLQGLDVQVLRSAKRLLSSAYFISCRWLRIPHPPSVRKLRKLGAKLIHAHFGTDAVDAWPLMRALGLPMLVSLYGYDINIDRRWWESGKGGLRRRSYPRQLLQLASQPNIHFLAVSECIRQRAIAYGIPPDKVTVSYLGADTEDFSPGNIPIAQRPKRVLFVGRLVEKKGATYLLKAFASVRTQFQDAELAIVGDGPMRSELHRLAASLNISVEFHGALTSNQVKAQMDQARILCVPSVTAENGDAEGLPMIILEAQAAGLPVVTSARGGVGEAVLHLKTGLAFPERSVSDLADNLIKGLSDDCLLQLVSEQARAQVFSRFDLKVSLKKLQAVYDEMSSQ